MIEIEADLAEFKEHLAPRVFDTAVRAATKKLTARAKTQINRATRGIYNIKAREINAALRNIPQDSGRTRVLLYKGPSRGLINFGSKIKSVSVSAKSSRGRAFRTRRKGVSVVVRKAGGRFTVAGAFAANGFGGKAHIFKRANRASNERGPIQRLTGPAIPQMVKHTKVRQTTGQEIGRAYSGILGHELTRVFNRTL